MVYLRIIALIFLGVMFFAQLLTASWYDIVKKTDDNKKAFKHKIICTLIYVATFLLCVSISNTPTNRYVLFFGIAIALLFIHDISEKFSKCFYKTISNYLGAGAYVLISSALYFKNAELFDFRPFTPVIRIIIPVAICLICVICSFKSTKISIAISSAYLLVNAVLLAISLQNAEAGLFQTASCAITLGAVALFISSVIPVFDKGDKKSLLRINTYYFGLMFISCSVAVL